MSDLRKTLENALIVFESIVQDEVAEGRRNSGAAQQARSGARECKAALAEVDEPSPVPDSDPFAAGWVAAFSGFAGDGPGNVREARAKWERTREPTTSASEEYAGIVNCECGGAICDKCDPEPEDLTPDEAAAHVLTGYPCAYCGTPDAPYVERRCVLHYGGQTESKSEGVPPDVFHQRKLAGLCPWCGGVVHNSVCTETSDYPAPTLEHGVAVDSYIEKRVDWWKKENSRLSHEADSAKRRLGDVEQRLEPLVEENERLREQCAETAKVRALAEAAMRLLAWASNHGGYTSEEEDLAKAVNALGGEWTTQTGREEP